MVLCLTRSLSGTILVVGPTLTRETRHSKTANQSSKCTTDVRLFPAVMAAVGAQLSRRHRLHRGVQRNWNFQTIDPNLIYTQVESQLCEKSWRQWWSCGWKQTRATVWTLRFPTVLRNGCFLVLQTFLFWPRTSVHSYNLLIIWFWDTDAHHYQERGPVGFLGFREGMKHDTFTHA